MRDKFKKILSLAAVATLGVASVAMAGCKDNFSSSSLGGNIQGEVSSNGGFVVEKGDYIYFINGAEDYSVSNNYGDVVKGALMRIAKSDFNANDFSKVQTVVPMLFVAQNFDAGIYIYGDYVYFASPTTEKNQSGEVQSDWVSFKRAKLDGTEAMKDYYFRSSNNAVKYRYVEIDGVVYCLHADNKTLYSYNTVTEKDTVLVSNAESDFYFDSSDPESSKVYYTMNVKQAVDTDNPSDVPFNQVYSVTADATVESAAISEGKATYKVKDGKSYSFNAEYLEDNLDGFKASDYTTYPYVNLGELVLDGIGSTNNYSDLRYSDTDVNKAEAETVLGYKYTIQSNLNDGIYFSRTEANDASTDGGKKLFYLANFDSNKEGWNSLNGNKMLDKVAIDSTNASASSLFFIKDNAGTREHSYIYVADSKMYKVISNTDGTVKDKFIIEPSANDATLWKAEGNYVYYLTAGTNGKAISRINYTGNKDDYSPLGKDEEYKSAKLPGVDWNSSWYKPEFIENKLLFSSAQSYGSGATSFNYIYAMNLTGANGDIMNAEELKALNEKYDDINDFIKEFSENDSSLQKLMEYRFRTGSTQYYEDIKKEAVKRNRELNTIYSDYAIKEFEAFAEHKKSENKDGEDYTSKFKDGDKFYDNEQYFMQLIGKVKKSDAEKIEDGWRSSLFTFTDNEKSESISPAMKILASVGIALAIAGVIAAVAVPLVIRKNKIKAAEAEEREAVALSHQKIDTTDDKSIDVYADDDEITIENIVASDDKTTTENTVVDTEEKD